MNLYVNTPSICQGNYTCDSRQPHICYNGLDISAPTDGSDGWTIIGYNTQDLNLPLFKVNDFRKSGVKAVMDTIAANQAMRYPHIIYMVVKTSDLWW